MEEGEERCWNEEKGSRSSRASLIAFDDDVIMKAKNQKFSEGLKNGVIRTTISPQKQARHILGSKECQTYAEKLSIRGDFPAYLREDISIKDLAEMIKGKLGSEKIELNPDNSFQEFFNCEDIIEYYYDKTEGKFKPTKRVQIQIKYSIGNGNIHVVPVKEK